MKIPFVSKVAQHSGYYRTSIPNNVVRNKCLNPDEEENYQIYFVEEL